jgi:hypothetical protein
MHNLQPLLKWVALGTFLLVAALTSMLTAMP